MASLRDDTIDVCEGALPHTTFNGEGERNVEMDVLSDGMGVCNQARTGSEHMGQCSSLIEHSANTQEPSVLFVVRDSTDSDWQRSRYNISLPHSSAIADLYGAIAKEAGYVEESFLLAWAERDSDSVDSAVPLAPKSTQTLYELGMPSEPLRCHLFLRDGPESAPVRVSDITTSASSGIVDTVNIASEAAGGQGETARDHGVAVSVSTATPHSMNNTSSSNMWPTSSSSSSYHYSNKSETGYVGLVNQAMTCYLNSLLQTLFMTPEFRSALYSWSFSGDTGEGIKSIPYQLQRLFIHLQISNKRAVETTDVTKSFGWDSSEAWQQHDVQELCRVMFDALEKRLGKDGHKRPQLINELYQGDMKDYVKCLECNSENAREDHFLDIPLVIKPFGSSLAYSSVDEALRGFVTPETLSGDNQYYCDKCKKKCDAHKGLKFTKFPYLLTLQLKRFDFDYSTMHRIKLNDRMVFPNVLDLNGFIDPVDLPARPLEDHLELEYKDFVVEKFEKTHSSYIMHQSADAEVEDREVTGSRLAEMLKQGPYVYELFSILIHSGSAIGGHYYAYIKSFTDKHWYCFNDQSVSRISREEIDQTFGGVDRSRSSYYSSSMYSSSANAYMLMYRRVDKILNSTFQVTSCLPSHIQEQIVEELQQEKLEKQRQEWEKSLCKFRVFSRHPDTRELLERKLEVHKDKTMRLATQEAYKLLGFSRLVSLGRCRLVRYDEYTDTLDQSFDYREMDMTFGHNVGGARSFYTFELYLEICPEGEEFRVYNKGGLNLKILVIDLPGETVREPFQMRGEHGWTVAHLKYVIAGYLSLNTEIMTVALETYQSEGKHLCHLDQTLKSEGFYRKHTLFVCCDAEDFQKDFQDSLMVNVLERHANTINILITVPPPRPPLASKARSLSDSAFNPPSTDEQNPCTKVLNPDMDSVQDSTKAGLGECEDILSEQKTMPQLVQRTDGTAEGASPQSGAGVAAAEGRSADVVDASDSDTCEQEEGGADVSGAVGVMSTSGSARTIVSSDWGVANSIKATSTDPDTKLESRVVIVPIDRRKNLGDLKKILEPEVQVPSMEFKIYRVYSNNQEYELFRLQDTLQSVPNETKMVVRMGRALQPGEFRIKVFLLQINAVEFFEPLIDSIVAKDMTVRDLKERIVEETYQQGVAFPYRPDRMRLRKKTWRSPGTVYTDAQVFEKDIHVFANYEMFVEPLEGEEPITKATQMQVYVRRWRPSQYFVDLTAEVILDVNTLSHLKQKLSQLSGLPAEDIHYAKSFGTFPCEMSVLDVESDLDWDPSSHTINTSPLSLYDDGAVLYYKDNREPVAEISAERREQLQKQETTRLSKYNVNVSSSSQSRYVYHNHRQEKALKIWTDDDDDMNTSSAHGSTEG